MGLFNTKKPVVYAAPPPPGAPPPDISHTQNRIEGRVGGIEEKIRKCELDIATYKAEMQRNRPGSSSYNSAKQRAMRAMKQRKMYEQQLGGAYNQQQNIDQVAFAKDTFQDVKDSVGIMKQANKELRKEMGKIDVDQVEDLHDDFEELLQETHEINEVLGRTYEVGDTDETAMMAELDAFEMDMIGDATTVPGYLQPGQVPGQAQGQYQGVQQPGQMDPSRYSAQ